MFERFINLLNQYSELNEQEIEYLWKIRSSIPVEVYRKNEMIFNSGEIFNFMYFVLDGCVRLYYYNDGSEKTAFFYTEGTFIRAIDSYKNEIPALENYQAIEETTLLKFPKKLLQTLLKDHSNFERIAHRAVESELNIAQGIISSFVTQTAEQRYLELIEFNNELFQNINQHYIASYLGITPESLSRIRKRALLKDKNQNNNNKYKIKN